MTFQRSYSERIGARMGKLAEFDVLARKALEEREFRYKEWNTWKPNPAPPTATRGWLLSKPRNSPALLTPAPTEGTMADAYNLAGQRRSTSIRLTLFSDLSRIPKTCKSGDGSARPK